MKNKKGNATSSAQDWISYYSSRGENVSCQSLNIDDFRQFPAKIIIKLIEKYFSGGKIIEIGAGDSSILIEACKRFHPDICYGLDYIESACDRLAKKSVMANVKIESVHADMFHPPVELKEKFDFVMSFGVVEHFTDLASVLKAISSFSKKNGIVFTLIPNNKNTIYGYLMKKWNIDVYNTHVMYDKDDIENAHKSLGLEVIWSNYVLSSNFGMLSWCFKDDKHSFNYWLYKQLTRISKIVWFFEYYFYRLKPSRVFAPYIVCVSRVI